MKYSAKHVEDLKALLLRSGGKDAEDLYQAVKERDARIAELEAAGKVLVTANTKHFDSARANYDALQDALKRLEAVEHELKGARDTADFYRADAYNSDVDGMHREERLKVLQRYMPTEETRSQLMTICQDQGELTMGQRVDQVVEAFVNVRGEIARQRRVETELRAEIHTLKDRNQELEKDAGNYRVKIGEMELRNPELKVDESLVPAWVHEQIDKTRWDIIAHISGHRPVIGLATRLVHGIHAREFVTPKDRDECWKSVIESAFYWADQDRPTRGDEEVAKLQAQIDRMTEDGVKAAEDRINEVYAKQQALVQDAFESGKKDAVKKCSAYLQVIASNPIAQGVSPNRALVIVAQELRSGMHEELEQKGSDERPTTPGVPVTATVSFKGTPLEGFFGVAPIGTVSALKRVTSLIEELQKPTSGPEVGRSEHPEYGQTFNLWGDK